MISMGIKHTFLKLIFCSKTFPKERKTLEGILSTVCLFCRYIYCFWAFFFYVVKYSFFFLTKNSIFLDFVSTLLPPKMMHAHELQQKQIWDIMEHLSWKIEKFRKNLTEYCTRICRIIPPPPGHKKENFERKKIKIVFGWKNLKKKFWGIFFFFQHKLLWFSQRGRIIDPPFPTWTHGKTKGIFSTRGVNYSLTLGSLFFFKKNGIFYYASILTLFNLDDFLPSFVIFWSHFTIVEVKNSSYLCVIFLTCILLHSLIFELFENQK